jgi:alkylation response protein AidB-like acyl-CoA dehydrogenase
MSGTVLEGSNHPQKTSIIEKIISGEHQVSVAYAEPNIGYNFFHCLSAVSKNGDGYILNGSKSLVLNGGNADQFIVLANHENSPILALIDAGIKGLSVQSFKTLDGQTCGELTFENIALDSESILASGDDAKALFNKMIDLSILCISAEAVGAMTSSYMKTVQYTKEREQFAQPISNFQVLQHRMVDMFIETELTKSLLIKATLQLDSDDPEAGNTISALKVQVGKAGRLVGQHAVQLHGGMGVSNEMSIGHYLKRFTAIDSMFGNTQHHINKYQSK